MERSFSTPIVHDQTAAKSILDSYIMRARERAEQPINRIMSEVPTDRIARGKAVLFDYDERTGLSAIIDDGRFSIHENALSQMADRSGLPMAFVRHMQEAGSWAGPSLARVMTEHATNVLGDERFLVREHGRKIRGFMSDRYRRINSREVLDTLIGESQKVGALVTDATVTDVRASVKILLPRVHEIQSGEFIALGLAWSNSDYGKGANALSLFALRVWCLNGATMEQNLRQVHLGSRLSDGITYGRDTIAADTRACILATRDAARAMLAPVTMQKTADAISKAAQETIDPKVKVADLRKRMGKTVSDLVANAYNTADVEALPPGNTAWRWSNAISWVAKQDTTDLETRIDLEREAGAALGR